MGLRKGIIKNNHRRVLISSKFPEKVMYEFKLLTTSGDVDDMRRTLDKVITAMEVAEVQPPSSSGTTTEVLHSTLKEAKGQQGTPYVQRLGLKRRSNGPSYSRAPPKQPKPECFFCQEEHYSDECKKYPSLRERKDKLTGRCFNCLRRGHNVHNCRANRKCYWCKETHHRALCPDRRPAVSSRSIEISDLPSLTTTCHVNQMNSILQTATVTTKPINSNNVKTLGHWQSEELHHQEPGYGT